jgi:hypothetical protein
MSEDNVVKMPDRLERYAFAIDAALVLQADAVERSEEASHDWRRATLDLAVELAKARVWHMVRQAFRRQPLAKERTRHPRSVGRRPRRNRSHAGEDRQSVDPGD